MFKTPSPLITWRSSHPLQFFLLFKLLIIGFSLLIPPNHYWNEPIYSLTSGQAHNLNFLSSCLPLVFFLGSCITLMLQYPAGDGFSYSFLPLTVSTLGPVFSCLGSSFTSMCISCSSMGCLDTSVLVVPGHVLHAQRHFYGHIQGLLPVHGLSGILLHVPELPGHLSHVLGLFRHLFHDPGLSGHLLHVPGLTGHILQVLGCPDTFSIPTNKSMIISCISGTPMGIYWAPCNSSRTVSELNTGTGCLLTYCTT